MEEKDPNLPKELCSLGFVLWVSFSLLSYYPVLRETYTWYVIARGGVILWYITLTAMTHTQALSLFVCFLT